MLEIIWKWFLKCATAYGVISFILILLTIGYCGACVIAEKFKNKKAEKEEEVNDNESR